MTLESLPTDLAAAHAMILAERASRMAAEVRLAEACAEVIHAKADLSGTEALIAHLKLAIEKLQRALYGHRSERQARLLDQMEFELEGAGGGGERGRDRGPGRSRADHSAPQAPVAPPLSESSAASAS